MVDSVRKDRILPNSTYSSDNLEAKTDAKRITLCRDPQIVPSRKTA